MFRPELYDATAPELVAARQATSRMLYGGVAAAPADRIPAGVVAWSLVHGLATLWRNGALPGELGNDPQAIARTIARFLFRPADQL